jgi:hypothetical protein
VSAAVAMTNDVIPEISLRAMQASDLPFVKSRMLLDLERFWPYRAPFNAKTVKKGFERIFPALLAKKSIVAQRRGGVVAFVFFDPDEQLVYYAYTANQLRRLGICRILLTSIPRPFRYAFDSGIATDVAKKLGGVFDPYALLDLLPKEKTP